MVPLKDFLYTVKVRAVNLATGDATEQLWAESIEAKANPGLPLDTPTGLAASWDFAAGMIKVTWNEYRFDPSAQFLATWLKYGVEDNALVDATESGGQTVAATACDIDVGGSYGSYRVRVRARNNLGPWSEWTGYKQVTASAFPEGMRTLARWTKTRESALVWAHRSKP